MGGRPRPLAGGTRRALIQNARRGTRAVTPTANGGVVVTVIGPERSARGVGAVRDTGRSPVECVKPAALSVFFVAW